MSLPLSETFCYSTTCHRGLQLGLRMYIMFHLVMIFFTLVTLNVKAVLW
jgi:hypothetical protein